MSVDRHRYHRMFTPRPRGAPKARPPARPPLVEWLPFPARRDLRAMLGRGFRHTRRGFEFPVGWTLERSDSSMGDRTLSSADNDIS